MHPAFNDFLALPSSDSAPATVHSKPAPLARRHGLPAPLPLADVVAREAVDADRERDAEPQQRRGEQVRPFPAVLSSHFLAEVEAVADRLLIIGNGKIVAAGTRDELLTGAGTLVRAADDEQALLAADLSPRANGNGTVIVDAEPAEPFQRLDRPPRRPPRPRTVHRSRDRHRPRRHCPSFARSPSPTTPRSPRTRGRRVASR
jgi:hypothetical protein